MLLRRSLIWSSVVASSAVVLASMSGVVASQLDISSVDAVIELFTSQGCSSCPAADRLLAALAHKTDIVAVSFPIDYWDYTGWRDTLASPAFTARQKAYAAEAGRHVYTPEVIIDGLTEAIGSDREGIEQAIAETRGAEGAMTIPLRLTDAGASLSIEVAAGEGAPAGLFLLRVLRAATVHIGRGENAGRFVTYTNVVRAVEKLGDWTGEPATFETSVSRQDDEGYVVLLQRGAPEQPGAILAAAKTAGL